MNSNHSHQSDRDLLDRIRTREELEARGYTRRKCEKCGGTGFHFPVDDSSVGMHECFTCKGRGFAWEAPMMR